MIRFAGVELLTEDPEGLARQFVERYLEWPRSILNSPTRSIDSKSRIQRPQWPDPPKLRPNQLYWPTGATRWSCFIGLASTEKKDLILEALDRVSSGTLELSLDDQPDADVTVTIDNGVDGPSFNLQEKISVKMYVLGIQPVSQTDDTLWIIPLVDGRFGWQASMFAATSTATSWAALHAQIEHALDVVIDRDTINPITAPDWTPDTEYDIGDEVTVNGGVYVCSGDGVSGSSGPTGTGTGISDGSVSWDFVGTQKYGVPDKCIFRNGIINSAPALDMYAWATNQRLVHEFDDTYRLRSKATAFDLYEAQRDAQLEDSEAGGSSAGGDGGSGGDADIPGDIVFHFTNDSTSDLHQVSQATHPDWAAGRPLEVMCTAVFKEDDDSNLDDLESLANVWSADFWLWSEYRFTWNFNRWLNWRFTGYEDYLLIDAAPSIQNPSVQTANTFVKSLPPLSFGWDFVPLQIKGQANDCGGSKGNDGDPGSGGGALPCCCNPLDCVDLCKVVATDVVTTCGICVNGALRRYSVDVGLWSGHEAISGTIVLIYQSGCEWRSFEYTFGSSFYQWVLIPGQYLQLQHTGGDDALGLTNGYRQIKYVFKGAVEDWACLCNMSLTIQYPERTPHYVGMFGIVCLLPYLTTSTTTPCVPCRPGADCYVIHWPGSAFDSCLNGGTWTGDDPSVAKNVTVISTSVGSSDGICKWVNTPDNPAQFGDNGTFYQLFTDRYAGVVEVGIVFNYSGQGVVSAIYQCRLDDWDCETGGTLSFVSQYSICPEPVWPATISVTISDCSFSSANPDNGFGCGYGSGRPDCTGLGCRYVADIGYINTGTPNSPDGPWTWTEYNDPGDPGHSGCGDHGCACGSPPDTPPVSYTDTYLTSCQ